MLSAALIGRLLEGALYTIYLTLGGAALGLVFAFAAGLARGARSRLLRGIGFVYIEFFRGAAVIVLAFWFVYALPSLGWQLDPLWAGILALSLNIGAYGAEVVRGAIRAVPQAQVEAATALNMTGWQRMRRVVLPQAFVAMVPPFTNNLIELLKASAVVSVVSIPELTLQGQLVRNGTQASAATFGGLLIGYGLIALVFIGLMRIVEFRAAASVGRRPEPGIFTRMWRQAGAGARP
ncbi:ectoine/hydroxyectoine ABC transporter permease subunit EhuC [Saccharopolyspora erythraea]|uniref:ectoine/hydroxyectoine ABC transporter permease subunit EhuC n=1 Tax=Saccharopolyspora erythraea TaxID=1836 RepID=UPI001BADF4F8|nr:ectoine/hydroxyectoine ABC transporter permease subunit EhuC [Saccharopolyspora erythraea]QUH04681.1 ectoine/hydroxyectoine ABC transporter permease subunit EhuC [Saccharopolyspora erythraea]